ncbi:hypothetical protein [Bradyrhizobium sp. SZCCHNS1054]|uniref:hypothetical protein n=1 Tax=Bradyrhizobium sp. SZCCHNS1054 TaxID=3057301 RepID=UPI002916C31B|nr:hypothetical protein [Bradyrhizobium sp. SZCCHNS1054]
MWVKRGDELGYLKYDRRGEEWLASKLGEMVLAPVAKVEWGILAGNAAVVSRVLSIDSIPLSRAEFPEYAVISALKRASGLIPFLLWIGAGDHGKERNFVVTPDGEGNLYIEAIDLGNCFEWRADGLAGIAILQRLLDNRDVDRVEAALTAIETLSDECVLEACRQSGMGDADDVAAKLISRKKSLRGWLAPLLR